MRSWTSSGFGVLGLRVQCADMRSWMVRHIHRLSSAHRMRPPPGSHSEQQLPATGKHLCAVPRRSKDSPCDKEAACMHTGTVSDRITGKHRQKTRCSCEARKFRSGVPHIHTHIQPRQTQLCAHVCSPWPSADVRRAAAMSSSAASAPAVQLLMVGKGERVWHKCVPAKEHAGRRSGEAQE
eukprot:364340-Chlamydomonas_euryale.AAC.11